MLDEDDDSKVFCKEMFNTRFQQLKRKGGSKYKFILRAGKSLHDALYRLFEVVWNGEKKPDSWRDTTIIQIWKGKGLKEDLNNKRSLHIKPEIQKFFGHMVTNQIKPIIVENISPFQIGAIPGHRAEEHLFTLKSFIMMMEKNSSAVSVELLDLVKYFDSQSLVDNMNKLHKGKVRGKLYRLVYELNKDTRIKVRTAVGESDTRNDPGFFRGRSFELQQSFQWRGRLLCLQ